MTSVIPAKIAANDLFHSLDNEALRIESSDESRHASSPFAVAVPVVLSLGLAGCAAADRNVRARRCSRMAFGRSGDATADGIRKS